MVLVDKFAIAALTQGKVIEAQAQVASNSLPSRWTTGVDSSKAVGPAKQKKAKDAEKKPNIVQRWANDVRTNMPSRWNLGSA